MDFGTCLSNAHRTKEPIPAFNVFDLASLRGVLRAASECARPIIVQFSERTVEGWSAGICASTTKSLAGKLRVLSAFVHLDHCSNPRVLSDAIAAGFDGVMFDGSHLDLPSNIASTNRWVELAHERGVVLEGEVTPISGAEDGIISAAVRSVEEDVAEQFVARTGVDLFGGHVGTHHGAYRSPPVIDFDRVARLARITGAGFVVHGGSGLSGAVLQRLASCGVAKVNFSTDLKTAWLSAATAASSRGVQDPLALLGECEESIRKESRRKFKNLVAEEST
jgi:ketose-bisphosphate aldolase